MRQLIEDILDLSRLEAGSPTPLTPISLNRAVEQVMSVHLIRAEENDLALTFTPGANLPPVMADPHRLTQVITNLVANAINYTPGGGVTVRTYWEPERSQVCLEVQDTGMGISADTQAHLFERFYRGIDPNKQDIPGSGLGLAIVKDIVDSFHGQIEVKSEVGRGSVFKVWLPVA